MLDGAETDRRWFRLRSELNRLSPFDGFDELLCLSALRRVEIHWYQVETVLKVLKQYRGRVLLADEVGLDGLLGGDAYSLKFGIGYLTSRSGDLPNHFRQNPEVCIV